MKKAMNMLIVAVLVMGTIQMILSFTAPAVVGPTPDDGVDGLQYINGDWDVNGTETYTDEIIVLTGNVSIHWGDTLILVHSTLAMNCTTENGTFFIEVFDGGSLIITDGDNDPTTTSDQSIITDSPFDTDDRSSSDFRSAIIIRDGASFSINNSVVSEMGFPGGGEKMGLFVDEADYIDIQNCTFENNSQAINFIRSANSIIGHNEIKNSDEFGLNIVYSNYLRVFNNNIHHNDVGAFIGTYFSSINDNYFHNNSNVYTPPPLPSDKDGVRIWWSGDTKFYNNTIEYNGGTSWSNNLEFAACSDIQIYNNTIRKAKPSSVVSVYMYNVENFDFNNNSVIDNDVGGIRIGMVGSSKNNRFMDNNISNNLGDGIFLEAWGEGSEKATSEIRNNVLDNNNIGLYLEDLRSYNVTNNMITSSTFWGVYVRNINGGTFANNTISATDYDFMLRESDTYLTVINCSFNFKKVGFNGGDPTLDIYNYLHLDVTDDNGIVPGAFIEVTNGTGVLKFEGFSDNNGQIRFILARNQTMTPSGNISYDPYNITAYYDAFTAYGESEPIMDQSKTVNVVFNADLPPVPPTGLLAVSNGTNVDLYWEPSPSVDKDHYLVYRNQTGPGWQLVYDSSTSAGQELWTNWTDMSAASDWSSYRYYVITVDAVAQESPPSNIARCGDWVVNSEITVTDLSAPMNGSLIILPTGNLTLMNVKLQFNSSFNNEFGVEVLPSGRMWILDNDDDPLTTGDQSYLSAFDMNYSFFFVMRGSEFVMKNSKLSDCGSNQDLDYISWDHQIDGPDIMKVGDPSSRGLYMDPSVSNVEIRNNEFNSNFVSLILDEADNNTITGNSFSNNVFDMYLFFSHDNIINGNTHTGCSGFPIYLEQSRNNTITQNDITNPSSTEAGLVLIFPWCSENTITDNDFSGGDYGIVTFNVGTNNNISNNNFSDQGRGIYLRYTSWTSLFDNDFDSITGYDCYLEYSHWNTIIAGTSNSGNNGYYLFSSSNVDISYVLIENATGTGIQLSSSSNFQMTDVTIKSSTNGIIISNGNSFILENIQIEDCTIGILLSSNPTDIMLENSQIGKGTDTAVQINTIDNFIIRECFLNATNYNFDLGDATVTSYNTTFNQTKITLDPSSSIILWWQVNVRVFDWLGNPQAGANVQIRQAAGTLIHDLSTDADGFTGWIWILERIQFLFFKESYTPHSFHAQFGTHAGDGGLQLNRTTLVTVWLENIGPTASNVIINPSLPTTISDLTLSYLYADEENDPEGNTMILWFIDGVQNDTFDNQTSIDSSFTTKGQTWFCEVIPHDGTTYGPPMISTPVTIQNTAPVVSNVQIVEPTPSSADSLHVTYDFSDIDNDEEFNSQYRWWVDNGTGWVYSGVDSLELSSSNTKKGESWKCVVTPNDGDDFGTSVESNVVEIGNSPPEVMDVIITPLAPQSNDTLQVSYNYFDLDNDLETGSTISWYKDNVLQTGLNDNPQVDFSLTLKDEVWYYIITPYDGDDFGPPVQSESVKIGNTPPSVSGIVISPSNPTTLDDLTVTYDFFDYDSDSESLDTVIKWLRWSVSNFFDTGYRGQTLPSELTSKGEVWTCEIIPHDGFSEGDATPSLMNVSIDNSPPSASNAFITPENPTAESNLTVNYDYSDPDTDPESGSTIRWYKDGSEQWGLNDSTQVDFSLTQKGEIWFFRITPSDGLDYGSSEQSELMTIGNTPPTVSNIKISPNNPIASDDLTASYDYFDLDGDSESLDTDIRWLRWSGSDFFDTGFRGRNLSSEHISKGEMWTCEVIPHDGADAGSVYRSAMNVTVGNSPPTVTDAYIAPINPDADANLSVDYQYLDPDSDLESGSTIRWYKDSVEQWDLNDSIQVDFALTLKGEIWYYIVTPSDGEDIGTSVQSDSVKIGNTPPYVLNITISPTDPDTTMDLTVSYEFYDNDGDSESLDTVVKWLRWDGFDFFDTGHRGKTLSSVFTARTEVWTCEVVPHDGLNEGTTTQSDMNVTIGNTPPVISNAMVTPEDPGSDSVLIPVYDYFDLDSDPESGSTIRWYKDGILQPALNDSWSVDFTLTSGNDEWSYVITPSDGNDSGPAVQSASVTIGNSLPVAFNVAISPVDPDTHDDLTVTYDYYDYDGDSESLDTTVRWLRWSGSVFFDTGLRGKTLSSVYTSKGEVWKCEVIPHDGVDEGAANQSVNTVTIGNAAPEAQECKISPQSPDADSDLVATYQFVDPDSDLESGSTIRWYKDNVMQPALNDSLTVNYTLTQKGEMWYYIVTPSDGTDSGSAVQSASVIIGNTPPTVSNIVITPADPKTGDDLSVTYDFYDEDGDGESLDTTVRWLRWSGTYFFDTGHRGKNLSSEHTLKGDMWTCDVIPHDGVNEGSATRSDMNVTVGNTAPEILSAIVTPDDPGADSILYATYDYYDPDSDSESGSIIRWYKDGILQSALNDSFSVDFILTNGNEVWYYIITPSDGEDLGAPLQSDSTTIGNTPPEASNIEISPLNPDTENDLSVTYDYYDFDGDLESLDTVVKWLRWSGAVFFDTGHRGMTLSSVYTSKGEMWTCEVIPHDGVEEGASFHCPENVTIGNSKPYAENAVISPLIPDADSDLIASYGFSDPDSDSESGSLISWFKNDIEQPGLEGSFIVNHSLTQKGDVWYYIVTPYDDENYGLPVQSDNVTIGNTPPSVSNVIISPTDPTAEDDLTVAYDFYDSDGDSESLDTTIKWLRWNGAFYEDTGYRGTTLSTAYTSKGEIWKCEVRPHDGLNEGDAVLSSTVVTITNSRPSASNAYISPDGAQTGSDLQANYDYADPDGDLEVGTEISWYRDGVHVEALDDQFTVSHTYTAKGQVWNFSVRPSDGTDYGVNLTSSSITIQNTKPTATDLTITPNPPLGDHDLVASYNFSDVDSDSEQGSEIKWYKNGILQSQYNDLLTVNSVDTKKGELWYFSLKVYDGEDYSDWIDSFYVEIENSEPIINNFTPDEGDIQISEKDSYEFQVDVEDPDGDLLLIKWRLDKTTVSDSEFYRFETDYESAGVYELNLTIQDLGQNSFTLYLEWQITVDDVNLPPEIEVQEPTETNIRIKEGEAQKFIIDKSDPDQEDIPEVKWYFDGGLAQTGGDSYTYAADDLAAGDHEIKAVVDDGEDTVEYTWDLGVADVPEEAKEELLGLSYDAWGLIMAVISGLAAILLFLFGFYRVRKKKGALKTYMAEIDEISTKSEDPVEYDYKLSELEEKINADFRDGHVEDLHYMMLQDIISSRRGEARKAEISQKFDRLPEGVVKNLDEMLKDGKISREEYEGFVATISKTTTLSPFEKKELSKMIGKWEVEDGSLPEQTPPPPPLSEKTKPKKDDLDDEIEEIINGLEDK
jgi:parallel beta-helix repeat protein